jgi:hypothetical protein
VRHVKQAVCGCGPNLGSRGRLARHKGPAATPVPSWIPPEHLHAVAPRYSSSRRVAAGRILMVVISLGLVAGVAYEHVAAKATIQRTGPTLSSKTVAN